MPDFAPPASTPPDELLRTLLSVSLTGVIIFQPVYAAAGRRIVDLAYRHLNPAARQMLGLPEQPTATFLTLFPHAEAAGIFAFYCAAFEDPTGAARRFDVNYQHDGLDNYFHLQAQRSGELLLVSFTDTASQERSAVEQALRESQAREREAHAEAELQRRQLESVFHQAPAMICIFEGPAHVFQFVNPPYQALVGERPLLGRPIAEAMPELAGQPIFALLDEVYQTGETFHATEMLVQLDHHNEGRRELEKRYYNFIYQARHNLDGVIDGIFVFAYDVTPQVLARQQVQHLHEEQRQLNYQLQATNVELAAAIIRAQQAQTAVERERNLLQALLTQAPVAIGLFQGPELTVAAANNQLCAMWGYAPAQVLGRPLLLAVPELRGQPFDHLIREVARTRVPFVGTEVPAELRQPDGSVATRYFNFVYQPLYDAAGTMLGVLDIAIDVTEQVEAHQRVQDLNDELGATNEELQATNEELLGTNLELLQAQQQLRRLTQELEARVRERTEALRVALRDTEEQRERLREQQSLLRQILGQVPAAIATLAGPEHHYSYFNDQYQQLTGHRARPDASVAQVLPEIARQGFLERLDEVYRSGQPFIGTEMPLDLYVPATDAPRRLYVDLIYQPLQDGQGQTTGILAFIIDSSEKVRARAAVEATARQLQLITDSLPVLISYVDREEHYRFVNGAYEAWFGQTREQLVGQAVRAVVGDAAYRNVKHYIDRVLGGERLEFEQQMAYRPDLIRHIHVDYIPDARDGQVWGFYALVKDVTEQVEARQQLATANEQLRASNHDLDALNQRLQRTNQDLDNFVYTASHDLKAPITNIEGLLQALTEQLPPEALALELVEPILRLMHGSVDRFKRTIDYLTDVSKLQQEYTQPTEPVDLAAIIDDVRQDLLPLLRDTRAQLLVDVAACPTISFSVKNLRSVVYNLLSNALKYHHPDRAAEVRISCQPAPDGYLRLTVQDNGLGFEESQQQRMFGMFQRLHTHVEGSGIGLYMVKKIVENAGGRITVRSVPGQGSEFSAYFPE